MGAWNLECEIRVHRDWDPISMKNQILSRYHMYIELSYESSLEWGP